ncbi:MAG: response regulator [Candidatus Riflebacteria bacterium]|nr:response regulator [Candidatus Riflebacteria bacterium]
MRILILEDDACRRRLFQMILESDGFEFTICADPIDFILELAFSASHIGLISLDHDLSEIKRSCGMMSQDCGCAIVEFMKHMKPICPVIIHSQNELARENMAEALKQSYWNVLTICDSPDVEGSLINNSWIELIRTASGNLKISDESAEPLPIADGV